MKFNAKIVLEQESYNVKTIYLHWFDFLIRTVLHSYCHACSHVFSIPQIKSKMTTLLTLDIILPVI